MNQTVTNMDFYKIYFIYSHPKVELGLFSSVLHPNPSKTIRIRPDPDPHGHALEALVEEVQYVTSVTWLSSDIFWREKNSCNILQQYKKIIVNTVREKEKKYL
jgi:hypothetical protein